MTASTLLKRHVHWPVVYLQIDAEGFDDEILLQFLNAQGDLVPFSPIAIAFESMLLNSSRVTEVRSHLRASGYTQQCQHGQNVVSWAITKGSSLLSAA